MIKRLLAFLLLLALCASTALAAPSWWVTDDRLTVQGLADDSLFVACYDEAGRFTGAKWLTHSKPSADLDGVHHFDLIHTNGRFVPLSAKTAGVSLVSFDHVSKTSGKIVLSTSVGKGTVRRTVTEKITGQVSSYNTHNNTITVKGKSYPIAQVTTTGIYDLTDPAVLAHLLANRAIFDFYFDPTGAICWAELVTTHVPEPTTALLLSISATGTAEGARIQAQLLWANDQVETVTVSGFQGELVTDENADGILSQLSAGIPGGLYLCRYEGRRDYDLTPVENLPGDGWGETLTIPGGTVTAPTNDFTQGALPCMADSNTVFAVVSGAPGQETVQYFHIGLLPNVEILQGYVVTDEDDSSLARFVYLRQTYEAPDPEELLPPGCVFVVDKTWADFGNYYQIDVVDAEGELEKLPVIWSLCKAMSKDSTRLCLWSDNVLVGKFCRISGAYDDGTVYDLTPVPTFEIDALSRDAITLEGRTYTCDFETKFVHVDLIIDDGEDEEAFADDVLELGECGPFNPYNFYDPSLICDPDSGLVKDAQLPFRRIEAVALSKDGVKADYVYVIRVIW